MFYVMSLLAIYAIVPISGSSTITDNSLHLFVALQLANGVVCYACAIAMMQFMARPALTRFWFIR